MYGTEKLKHIAFIMDGNGRWAESKGLPRKAGHEQGAKVLVDALRAMQRLPLECVSFYAFSTENEKRNSDEVGNILGIIAYFLQNEILPLAMELHLQVRFIGDIRMLPLKLSEIILEIAEKTINNKGMKIVFAIGYGGTFEIANAFNLIFRKKTEIGDFSDITSDDISHYLYTVGLPNPDVIIRYGGQKRLSNFMPLQSVYSEIYFLDEFWPDFDINQVNKVIDKYNKTTRNFGGING